MACALCCMPSRQLIVIISTTHHHHTLQVPTSCIASRATSAFHTARLDGQAPPPPPLHHCNAMHQLSNAAHLTMSATLTVCHRCCRYGIMQPTRNCNHNLNYPQPHSAFTTTSLVTNSASAALVQPLSDKASLRLTRYRRLFGITCTLARPNNRYSTPSNFNPVTESPAECCPRRRQLPARISCRICV